MQANISTCALIGKFEDARVAECARTLCQRLFEGRLQVLALDEAAPDGLPAGVTRVSLAQLLERTDLVIAIGGDGTLLYAAGLVAESDIPLLGINRGRLGFLTDVLPQDMAASIDAVLSGACEIDRRLLLEARLTGADGRQVTHHALNDVVFSRLQSGRMLVYETHVDGRYLNAQGGDGLVVATATGSTAYALSCGGPIIEPRLNVLVLAPICPHTLSDRPIIVPGDARIDIQLTGDHDLAQVTCDAFVLGELHAGGRLEIRPSARAVRLLHPPGYDYFRLLRSKLHWGLGGLVHER